MTVPTEAMIRVARLLDLPSIDAATARGYAIGRFGLSPKQVMKIDLRSETGWSQLGDLIKQQEEGFSTTASGSSTTHRKTSIPVTEQPLSNQTTHQTTAVPPASNQETHGVPPMTTQVAVPEKIDYNGAMAHVIESIQRSDLRQFKDAAKMQVALVEASVEADRISLFARLAEQEGNRLFGEIQSMQERMIPGNPIANLSYQLAVYRLTQHIIRLMAATSGMPETVIGEQVAQMVGVEYAKVAATPPDPQLEDKINRLRLVAGQNDSSDESKTYLLN